MSDQKKRYAEIETGVWTVNYRDGVFMQGERQFDCASNNSAGAAAIMLNRYHDALKAGEDMRRYQRDYFRTRDNKTLMASKLAERRFDQLMKLALN